MTVQAQIRPQSRWIVQRLARDCDVSEMEAERALLELIQRGHIKIVEGAGPRGEDALQPVLKPRGGRQ